MTNKMRAVLLILLAGLFNGCAVQIASRTQPDGSKEKLTHLVCFNKAALQKFSFAKKTKTTDALLSYDQGDTETQGEAIKQAAEAFGVLVGTAAKAAAK